jgi:glycosyltransferase involved in cell wall biosynthesis
MRIAFTLIGNSRRSNFLTGDTIRFGGAGASGTDTSTILIAEHLASKGHEVVVTSDPLEPQILEKCVKEGKFLNPGTSVRGVIYTNISFDGVLNKTFDILVNSLWFDDYKSLPIKITKGLIYWNHLQWCYGIDKIIEFVKENNLKLAFIDISQWQKELTQSSVDHARRELPNGIIQTLIPNPIMDDEIRKVLALNIPKKKHKVVFHASWPRGGNVAIQTVRDLGWTDAEFHAFDYLLCIHDHKDSCFFNHSGVDKQTLFRHIAEAEYFIYPLYTPYQDVHKDTFSCVVAEALAFNTSVVTYPLGALPEIYKSYVNWTEWPAGVDLEKLKTEPLTKDTRFNTTIPLVKKIQELEQNIEYRANTLAGASSYILDSFNLAKVGYWWETLIDLF